MSVAAIFIYKLLIRHGASSFRKHKGFSTLLQPTCIFEKAFNTNNELKKTGNVATFGVRGFRVHTLGDSKHTSLLKNMCEKFFTFSDTKSHPHLWSDFEKEAMEKNTELNSNNFDGVLMAFLRQEKLYDRAESFLKYIEENRKVNDPTLVNYMIAAAENGNESAAIKAYQKINKDLFLLPVMQVLVIQGLANTSLWKESLDILKLTGVVYAPSWMQAAVGAFRHKDIETGKKLIEEIVNSDLKPHDSVLTTWLNLISSVKDRSLAENLMDKFLDCLRRNRKILSVENADQLSDIFTRQIPSRINSVNMQSTGYCPRCHYKLEEPRLTLLEHAQLTKTILNYLRQGSSSYERTNPQELEKFMIFLENSRPYNIVVDALNVAHKQSVHHPKYLAKRLLEVVTALIHQGYRPLVLGKRHIRTWNKQLISQLEKKAKCFYADNISADDPFIVYAALYGGPNTLILTNDLLRDHAFLLPTDQKKLFQTWKYSIQVSCENFDGKVEVLHLKKYALRAQGDWINGFHIPYEKEGPYKDNLLFCKQRLHWLCIKVKFL